MFQRGTVFCVNLKNIQATTSENVPRSVVYSQTPGKLILDENIPAKMVFCKC